jgi:hypothetical protein
MEREGRDDDDHRSKGARNVGRTLFLDGRTLYVLYVTYTRRICKRMFFQSGDYLWC